MAGMSALSNFSYSPPNSMAEAIVASSNQAMAGIIHSKSAKAANTYASAHSRTMSTWSNIQNSVTSTMVEVLTVGLATIQQKLLKEQLNHQKEISKQKSALVQEQITLARDTIKNSNSDYNDIYKKIQQEYGKIIDKGIGKKFKPDNEFFAGRGSASRISQLTGLSQKIKDSTSPYNSGALVYKMSKLQVEKIMAAMDGAAIGYAYENERIEDWNNNSQNMIERFVMQGQNVKNQSANAINMLNNPISQLNPDVSGAQNAYLAGLGNLSGSLYNLFSGLNLNKTQDNTKPIPILEPQVVTNIGSNNIPILRE